MWSYMADVQPNNSTEPDKIPPLPPKYKIMYVIQT